jgi:putative ABC transport system permease protein
MTAVAVSIGLLVGLACLALAPFALILSLAEALLARAPSFAGSSSLLLLVRSMRRNRRRTWLTFVATFVLVFVVAGLWSVLYFLDELLADKAKSPRVIVTDKWQLGGQMPFSYASSLARGAARKPGDVRPTDEMTWQIYLGTTEPANPSPDNIVPIIAMQPAKVLTMLHEIFEELATDGGSHRARHKEEHRRRIEEGVRILEANKRGVILGARRLAALNKRVGEWIKLTGMQFRGIDLELQIVGVFPAGKYSDLGVINRDYFNDSFDDYARKTGLKHPQAGKNLSMMWLEMAGQQACSRVAEQLEASGLYQDPPVKCQTLSAEVAAVLDAYADLIWGMRWLLSPAILVIMVLVMANSIGISVRERQPEIALLKVLGFRPAQILVLVLGEPMLIGALAGLLSALFSRFAINEVLNQMTDNVIDVPLQVLWWSPAAGLLTALAGSLAPALSACRVAPAQVFARAV